MGFMPDTSDAGSSSHHEGDVKWGIIMPRVKRRVTLIESAGKKETQAPVG